MEKWEEYYNPVSSYLWNKNPYWNYDRVLKLYKKEFPEVAGNFVSHNWFNISNSHYCCETCGIHVYWGHEPENYITIPACYEKINEDVVKDILL